MKWILLMLILLASCGEKMESRKNAEALSPVVVKTVRARAVDAPVELALTGTFVADSSSTLASEAEGVVAATPVRIGDSVAAGVPVVVLNQQAAQLRLQEALAREQEAAANLKQAEARLGAGLNSQLENVPEVLAARAVMESALAEQRLLEIEERRAGNLLKGGDVSRASYDRAQANLAMGAARVASASKQYDAALNQARQSSGSLDAARAALESARAQAALARKALADTTIRAPFAGFVSARMVAAGEFVNNQTKLVTIDRIQPLKLQVQVPESEAARVRAGLKVRARVQAFGEEWFDGTITNVNSAVNPTSRSFLIEAHFPNAQLRLKPGMFAEVLVDMGRSERLVLVPAAGLELDNRTDSNRVWTLNQGVARLKLVELAGRSTNEVRVRRGLPEDAVVIVSDRRKLFDGATVLEK